ncbi:MAG: ABC transporter permease subunit [Euryarchaeota archaeon]|nr:ABC transporter permease subunit [Euryarchaeota archaeon]MDE1835243.1 ABC transporter permease subunit [Euryarchaeota archaeon]MDE1881046.1 ABC transporter permease subunit [Euryarchaeota archaeon]MDE2043539.1 ABC transporter permease subunit [Thermoplasmata archaeon]
MRASGNPGVVPSSAPLARLRSALPWSVWGLAAPLAVLPVAPGILGDLPGASAALAASFVRMLLAYVLSLGFSLAYGYAAAVNRTAERVLIPILDILQSVPILGFFPFAVYYLIALTPGSLLGPNVAAIFLIFTSMSWNMAFGVYESIKGIPSDMTEAAGSFGLSGGLRLRHLFFPATINRLVYNSVLSWTAGWYYLVGAEIIGSVSSPVILPGIGSYLYVASEFGHLGQLLAGTALLVALIAALDLLVWKPAGRWAERYRYDQSPSGESDVMAPRRLDERVQRGVSTVARGFVGGVTRVASPLVNLGTTTVTRIRKKTHFSPGVIRYALVGGLLVLGWFILIAISVAVFHVVSGPVQPSVRGEIDQVPLALGTSFARVVLAYGLSLAITFPVVLFFVRRARAAKFGMPIVEIIASFPAPAIFPILLLALVGLLGLQATVIIAVMTGMVWYVFFNVYSGLKSLPPDLEEAGRSLGLKGSLSYRRLTLPAIFPAFVTGSITAFGGGWNSLIYAEWLVTPPPPAGTGGAICTGHGTLGLGQLLEIGTWCYPNSGAGVPLMAISLFTLVGAVIAVNELLWKPLYRRTKRYTID